MPNGPVGRLVTLENFIIDTFTRVGEDGVERPVYRADEIGGGGSYGARIFLPPERLGMIVDYTPESFPDPMRAALEKYGSDMWYFRLRNDGYPTNKSVNSFEYLNPAKYLHLTDILQTSWKDPPPRTIHLISDANRLQRWDHEMAETRRKFGVDWDPMIIWEPEPYDNVPANIALFRRFVPQTTILSPNHTETLSLLSLGSISADPLLLRQAIEEAAQKMLSWTPRLGVVIRAGSLGACWIQHGSESVKWVPAYWSEGQAGWEGRVVDPTGAGNAFCGGLAAALDTGLDLENAVLWGTVAASFVVEQHGLPGIAYIEGEELWNGEKPLDRVLLLKQRSSSSPD